MILIDTLNRWRIATINWIDVTLVRWQYKRDYDHERELRVTDRTRWIDIAKSNWKRWGSWSHSRIMYRASIEGWLDKGGNER